MDFVLVFVGVATTVAAIILLAKISYDAGRFNGIRQTTMRLTDGISFHYEYKDRKPPEGVAKTINEINARVRKARTIAEKCDLYYTSLSDLSAMGEAAYDKGFDAAHGLFEPRSEQIHIVLPTKELLNLTWLAHFGFENMIPKYSPFSAHHFLKEEEAQAATGAIERLERAVPKQYRDPEEPYALAESRHQLIWQQWPAKKERGGVTGSAVSTYETDWAG